jgi:hypothetical protein
MDREGVVGALTEEDVAKYATEAKKRSDEGGDIKF